MEFSLILSLLLSISLNLNNTMNVNDLISDILNGKNPEKVFVLTRFFKTGKGEYGEGDKFIGVTVPYCRQLAKKYVSLELSDVHSLLESPFHEIRMCGGLIIVEKYARAKTVNQQSEIISFYLSHTANFNNWDLVDLTCYKTLGKYLLPQSDRSVLYSLAASKHLWTERIAMVTTYAFIREGQFDDTFRLAEMFLNHRHDLMHKATGWMLKEIAKRDLYAANQFLKDYYKKMPRTMLRYAIEKHPDELRAKFLKGEV
jgi:3-methyladenine DNA glycosylase AlkD